MISQIITRSALKSIYVVKVIAPKIEQDPIDGVANSGAEQLEIRSANAAVKP